MVTQFLDKGYHLLSLHTYTATHGLWQTSYYFVDLLLVYNSYNSLYIRRIISAVEYSKRAGQYATGVTEGYPYPLIANIKTQATRNTPPIF